MNPKSFILIIFTLSLLLLTSLLFGQSSSKYESVSQCVLQTRTEKKLTGNEMFELVKEECERILGKVETGVGKRKGGVNFGLNNWGLLHLMWEMVSPLIHQVISI